MICTKLTLFPRFCTISVGMRTPRQAVPHMLSFARYVLLCPAEQVCPHFEHWTLPARLMGRFIALNAKCFFPNIT